MSKNVLTFQPKMFRFLNNFKFFATDLQMRVFAELRVISIIIPVGVIIFDVDSDTSSKDHLIGYLFSQAGDSYVAVLYICGRRC